MNTAFLAQRTGDAPILNNQAIAFETVLLNTGSILYDSVTGEFTFIEQGRYVVDWNYSSQQTTQLQVKLSFVTSDGGVFDGNTPLRQGQLSGIAVFDVTTPPVMASLRNTGGSTVYSSTTVTIKSDIRIIREALNDETLSCFALRQFTHILSQFVSAYNTNTWTVFPSSLASFSGTPLDLYTAPDATGPGILRLMDTLGGIEMFPISNICAIYPGADTVYDPSFTWLTPPSPLPTGCEDNVIMAIQSSLNIGDYVSVRTGPSVSASGSIYQNHYGVLVLSDEDGNTPILIYTPNLLRVYLEESNNMNNLNQKGKTEVKIDHI